MSEHEKFPTLFDDDNYLIFRDKDMVTLVDHGRGISSMFPYEEWREFSRVIVSAANKDCELSVVDEQTTKELDQTFRFLGGVEVRRGIHRMIEITIKPLQDRIAELEQTLRVFIEQESKEHINTNDTGVILKS